MLKLLLWDIIKDYRYEFPILKSADNKAFTCEILTLLFIKL